MGQLLHNEALQHTQTNNRRMQFYFHLKRWKNYYFLKPQSIIKSLTVLVTSEKSADPQDGLIYSHSKSQKYESYSTKAPDQLQT